MSRGDPLAEAVQGGVAGELIVADRDGADPRPHLRRGTSSFIRVEVDGEGAAG